MDFLFSMKVFTLVVDTGSMTKAGESLFLTQPAVSMRIKSLEDFYGFRLFNRLPKELKITKKGKLLYSYAKKLLHLYSEMNSKAKILTTHQNDISVGKLNLGSCILISEIYMPLIIQGFTKIYPDIEINLTTGGYQTIIQAILEDRLDLAIVGYRNESMRIEEHKLKFEKVIKEKLDIILPKSYNIGSKQEVDFHFLIDKKFVSLKPECGITCIFRRFLEIFNAEQANLQVSAVFESGGAIKSAVSAGLGWSVLPSHFITQELSQGLFQVAKIRTPKSNLERWLYLVYKPSKKVPPLDLFIQFIMRQWRKQILSCA